MWPLEKENAVLVLFWKQFWPCIFSREHTLRTTHCVKGLLHSWACDGQGLSLQRWDGSWRWAHSLWHLPSPELKRHSFHTLSQEALSGRPVVSSWAKKAFGLGNQWKARPAISQLIVSRVALAPWGRAGAGSQECRLRLCALMLGYTLRWGPLRNWLWNGIRLRNLSIAENFVSLFKKVCNSFYNFIFFSKIKKVILNCLNCVWRNT